MTCSRSSRFHFGQSGWVINGLLFLLVLMGATVHASAETREPSTPNRRPSWHVLETANFRLLCYGHQAVDAHTAQYCEQVRQALVGQWQIGAHNEGWRPKCDLVLHPSDESYLRTVGEGGRSTVASALVDRREGRVVVRRVDIRATRENWKTDALAHELTHVVIADRFSAQSLPRWIDEGIAIQADPDAKRTGHRKGAQQAVAGGSHFRLVELLNMPDYPPAGRWATFYDQSAAIVEYLVAQGGHDAFLRFVDLSLSRGYHVAAREVYTRSLAQLETGWLRSMTGAMPSNGRRSNRELATGIPVPATDGRTGEWSRRDS